MKKFGFTIVEMTVSIAVFTSLLAFTVSSLISNQRRTSLAETMEVLIADIRQQQLYSMQGFTESLSPASYGVYYASDRYVLFRGSVYNPASPQNFTVQLDPNIRFTGITFPSSQIVFGRGSGEAANFVLDTYDLEISDQLEGVSHIITLNRYGTITQVN